MPEVSRCRARHPPYPDSGSGRLEWHSGDLQKLAGEKSTGTISAVPQDLDARSVTLDAKVCVVARVHFMAKPRSACDSCTTPNLGEVPM
jgi:hypothetical protein